ncbi:MAG: FHA domain-containing protein, partial [Catenulispora sp.]|nr:FHA domain-containing protein [Catenulispora sp.]
MELRLGRPDAVVADLAGALGSVGGGLVVDGRPTPPGTPLADSGMVMGSEVSTVLAEDWDPGTMADEGLVLRVVGGLDAGLSRPLPPGRFRLGRGEQADIRVECPDISRLHCELDVGRDGRVTVRDLGSRNGTDLNGVRLKAPAVVGPRDVVCAAGRVPFRVLPAAALGPVQYVNPAREAGPGGVLPFNRAPRL